MVHWIFLLLLVLTIATATVTGLRSSSLTNENRLLGIFCALLVSCFIWSATEFKETNKVAIIDLNLQFER